MRWVVSLTDLPSRGERGARAERPRLATPLALALLGCGLELAYLALWPISYRLTHGGQFTYEYLLEFEPLWLRLHAALEWWEAVVPQAPTSLELNVNLLLAVFAALFALYFTAATVAYRWLPGRGSAALILAWALLFQVTLFFMPGLFTTDVFSYAMYGRIGGVYGFNPYFAVPGDFEGDRLVEWIHPIWHFAPSVYGPLWVNLSAWLSAATWGWTSVDQVLAYKAVVNLAHLANVGLTWALLGQFQPKTRVAGLLLFAWNPLLLFEFAGNGHNDALMLTFLLLGLLLLARGRPEWGVLGLGLSVWVKYATALVAPLYLAVWARRSPTLAGKARMLLLGGLSLSLLGLLLYLPWWEGPAVLGPIFDWARGPLYANHPPRVLARLLVDGGLVGAEMDREAALRLALEGLKQATRLLLGGYLVWEVWRTRTLDDLAPAAARVFLVFLLVVQTWVLSWYFTWPVALGALLGLGHSLARVVLGLGYTILVVSYFQGYWGLELEPARMLAYLAPLGAPLVEAGLRRAVGPRPRKWRAGPVADATAEGEPQPARKRVA